LFLEKGIEIGSEKRLPSKKKTQQGEDSQPKKKVGNQKQSKGGREKTTMEDWQKTERVSKQGRSPQPKRIIGGEGAGFKTREEKSVREKF